jgi:hypothetical protein
MRSLWRTVGALVCTLGFLVSAAVAADAQRQWQIGDFTTIQRVPREPGSEPNQQPRVLPPEQLRGLLASLRVTLKGKSQPLFANDEIGDLIEPLAQALAAAGPDDDLLLLSTARRGDAVLAPATGITARVFVQADQLQFIVHDARSEFMGAWIGTRIRPKFSYGTRAKASGVEIGAAGGQARRTDWQGLPLDAAAVVAAPAATPAPVRDPGVYQEQEQRLRGLKRLLEQGLITETEYQQKRREILQTL